MYLSALLFFIYNENSKQPNLKLVCLYNSLGRNDIISSREYQHTIKTAEVNNIRVKFYGNEDRTSKNLD